MIRNITRRRFLRTAVGATAALGALRAQGQRAAGRPNVLFILADDLGYGDLSCYGRPDYETPVLDRLATQGMKFMSAYAAAPVCTPTRCAFVTGRYPQRLEVGLQEPLALRSPEVGIPADHPTVASLLRDSGYETALIGKWHLGWRPEFGPNRLGFDEFFGSLSGALDYFTHVAPDAGRAPGAAALPDLWENTTRLEREGYLTDLYTERAVEFIARPHDKPFYLSLHYTAPHSPWEGPADAGVDHDDHGVGPMIAGGSLDAYAAMMQSMDAGIGRVLAALRRARLERNTLVIFTSDNGGERYSYHWPFSFEKLYLWEGGIRVPAIVRWPGVVPANRVTEQAAITMDWTAMILGVAGAQAHPAAPLDGEDLLPICTGERAEYQRELFWRTQTRAAARLGDWKYVNEAGTEHLYDLTADLGEKTDLRTKRPDIFERVRSRYQEWAAQMLPRPTPV
jgi:arylsulfatase A-like enzyme